MSERKINIYSNDTALSRETEKKLCLKLKDADFKISEKLMDDCELMICIGGDGAFLEAVHLYEFPEVPIIGINTGHLGFFQEIYPNDLDTFIESYKKNKYQIQELNTVEAFVSLPEGRITLAGLNEIVIKGDNAHSVHLSISIGEKFIQRSSGDGILVATPSGSTAYNYSLGGSIVDPRIKLLQVTPIAPMNTTAYRSFTSSILLPSDLQLAIVPEESHDSTIYIINDGIPHKYNKVNNIEIKFSDKTLKLLRLENYYFWDKVKTKFL